MDDVFGFFFVICFVILFVFGSGCIGKIKCDFGLKMKMFEDFESGGKGIDVGLGISEFRFEMLVGRRREGVDVVKMDVSGSGFGWFGCWEE